MSTCLQSLQSMGAIIILMFTFLLMFAVIFREMFSQSDPSHFGTMFRTVFTLFQLLTLDDWSFTYSISRDNGKGQSLPLVHGFVGLVWTSARFFSYLYLSGKWQVLHTSSSSLSSTLWWSTSLFWSKWSPVFAYEAFNKYYVSKFLFTDYSFTGYVYSPLLYHRLCIV